MQYGYRIIDDMIAGMKAYMTTHGIKSVSELVGAALPKMVPADMLDRSTVVYPSFDSGKCLGCGRCYISCSDAGHQAIVMKDGKARLQAAKCVGCHLCMLVCHAGAIVNRNKRVTKPKRG
jgi:dihydropyrimidine dehydrogenase (NAD+) subunit PreA